MMLDHAQGLAQRLVSLIAKLRFDTSGQITIIFALASTAIVAGTGAGIDLSRAYLARQKISETATLTCQYSSRPSVIDLANTTSGNSNGMTTYLSTVNTFAATTLTGQRLSAGGNVPTGASNGTLFTAGAPTGTGATATAPTNPVVDISLNVPTFFLRLANIAQIPVHAHVICPIAQNTAQGSDTPGGSSSNGGSGNLLNESFEVSCTSLCFVSPSGTTGTLSQPSNTFPTTPSFTGDHGSKYYIVGYCLEIDSAGQIFGYDPQGTHAAELDCDNGSGSAGNSSISTKIYMPVGNYELRWDYGSRLLYSNYYPSYICGSTASDVGWANDTSIIGLSGSALRTNQINVYLDMSVNGAAPGFHTTIDGSQQLAGSNLIDTCVYAPPFIERSVKIVVTTPAYYWLSFAADGANDSYGGTIDNIRLCIEKCAGTPPDNFPSSWLAANNGGTNKLLFEDTFENPTYSPDAYASSPHSKSGNLNLSLGTTTTSVCGSYQAPPGWPCQNANGWGTGPYNEEVMDLQGAYQGSQYATLDGSNTFSSGYSSTNRAFSRPFLLDPGYYRVDYNYISNVNFASTVNYSGTFCTSAPASGLIYPGYFAPTLGQIRYASGVAATDESTNFLGTFMSYGPLVSTPNIAGAPWATSNDVTYSAPSLGATTSYNNPDGTVSTTPTVPPDKVTWSNYNAAAVNPVIDTCGYVDSFRWAPRSVSVKITKPGVYWLTFSANGGTADGNGPGIDDVKLTALGSLYMSNPPTSALTTIPVASPQPDTIYNNSGAFNGFYIIADPKTPTAADQ